jgi:tRNA (uracil-5-)-methyltransferase TRM9
MDAEKIGMILESNKRFYNDLGGNFFSTRQNPWPGWKRAIKEIEVHPKSVLDLGCGNGRFYKFLRSILPKNSFSYLGVDQTNQLPKGPSFKKLDIFTELDKLNKKFDLLVAFGVTHHIPGKKLREKWFTEISNLSNKYIALTFWNFLDKKPQKAKGLEKNDYFLGWGGTNAQRYCHFYDENELYKIKEIFRNNDFELISEFKSDRLNKYHVYKKSFTV